jgi:hypothetical protein
MSEELNEVQEEQVEEVQQTQVQEPSEVEKLAMEQGWRPKEEFNGTEHEWVPADEFVRRGPLFKKIDTINKKLKDTERVLRDLQNHHLKVRQVEFQHAVEALRAEKKAALTDGDADKLIEIDDKLADVKAAQIMEVQRTQQATKAPDPRFLAWVNSNPWYGQDPELRFEADEIGTKYAAAFPDKDPEEILVYVSNKIRRTFPEKFTNPNRAKPNVVEGNTGTPPVKKTSFTLSEEEVKVMKNFERAGIIGPGGITKEEYMEQVKQTRGVV